LQKYQSQSRNGELTSMTVKELITMLQQCPQDATVKADAISLGDEPMCYQVDGIIPNQVEGNKEVVLDLIFEHN
jgi:hypothetical protein